MKDYITEIAFLAALVLVMMTFATCNHLNTRAENKSREKAFAAGYCMQMINKSDREIGDNGYIWVKCEQVK